MIHAPPCIIPTIFVQNILNSATASTEFTGQAEMPVVNKGVGKGYTSGEYDER
jgi:hypothetical protein